MRMYQSAWHVHNTATATLYRLPLYNYMYRFTASPLYRYAMNQTNTCGVVQ